MKAAREFPLRTREKMTFEYVLIAGVTDAPEHAREVVELVRGMRARINLIALNPGTELPYRTPEEDRVAAFRKYWWRPEFRHSCGVREGATFCRLRTVEENNGSGAR